MPRGRPRKNPEDDVLLRSAEYVGWALGGLEREIDRTRERLSSLTEQAAKLRDRVAATTGVGQRSQPQATPAASAGGTAQQQRAEPGRRRRRRMSAEARRLISEQMKKRWAERKRGQ